MTEQEGINRAGDVLVEQLTLIASDNTVIDLNEFVVELNLFEDLFSNFLHGNLVLSDSRNLIEKLNLHGEEVLILKVRTPSLDKIHTISKTFRTYKISDRKIVRDNNTQTFVIHFTSAELFLDVLLPLFISFEGNISDVVENIFQTYVTTFRDFEIDSSGNNITTSTQQTPFIILNTPSNKVKFVSPGWSPFKCINWLASKSIPENGKSSNFIFFESNKSFYFGSVEYILKNAVENNSSIGTYFIGASNISETNDKKDLNREMFIARDVEMVSTVDQIKNFTNGYLANRLIFLDVHNKKYEAIDYDHVNEYKNYFHTSGQGSKATPPFFENSLRNFSTNISFYPKNPKLYDNFEGNINEKMDTIYGNRKSSLLDLTNIKMNITVPGRTDIEVGRMLYFLFPSLDVKSEADTTSAKHDKLYSGNYLITAIRHKINKNEHTMTMEIVKDPLYLEETSE